MRSVSNRLPIAALALVASTLMVLPAAAQDLHPSRRPSPMGMARTTIGDAYVRVVYSRPYERGRDNIFGTEESEALVPYGKVWRTGANEATEITVTGDVMVAGQALPAGTYSLFTTPGPEEWTIHFVGALGLNGTGRFVDGEFQPVDLGAETVLAVTAPAGELAEEDSVDQFTIAFEEAAGGGTDMVLRWIRTEVRVPISAP